MRRELGLTYIQIGLLAGIPMIASGFAEPVLGILGNDRRKRRFLVLCGGALFAASCLLTAASSGFAALLVSFVLFYPGSGLFVSLSQAELADREAPGRDRAMALWTFAGSMGAVLGPLALGAAAEAGLGWRALYLGVGAASGGTLLLAARFAFPAAPGGSPRPEAEETRAFLDGLRGAARALRGGEVARWLVLLELANLMLDVLLGYLALYFVEVAGVSAARAAFALTLVTGAEVVGDFLVIPLLDRLDGLSYLRASAGLVMVLFPAFLLAGPFALKLALACLTGLARAGGYAVLQARLYESLPGWSGAALAVSNIAGLVGALIPLGLGVIAEKAGLPAALWVLLAAPLALLMGLRRNSRK